jgi:hypothetical protein
MINEPRKWEYRLLLRAASAEVAGDLNDEFQRLGAGGWELVSSVRVGDESVLLVFKRPSESQRQEQWVLDYLQSFEVNWWQDLLSGSATQVVCCPFGLGGEPIDFTCKEMEDWRLAHQMRDGSWLPSSFGMRAGWARPGAAEGGDTLWEVHANGAVNHVRATVLVPDEGDMVNVAGVMYGAGYVVALCRDLYDTMDEHGTALLRLKVTGCGSMRFHIPATRHPLSEPAVTEGLLGLVDGTLQLDEKVSIDQLRQDPSAILQRVAERVFHTLGCWRVPLGSEQLKEMLGDW